MVPSTSSGFGGVETQMKQGSEGCEKVAAMQRLILKCPDGGSEAIKLASGACLKSKIRRVLSAWRCDGVPKVMKERLW